MATRTITNWWKRKLSLSFRDSTGIEDYFLGLHLVEDLIAFHGISQRHDFVEHESKLVSIVQTSHDR